MIAIQKFAGYFLIFVIILLWQYLSFIYHSPFFPSFIDTVNAVYKSVIIDNLLFCILLSVFHSTLALSIAIIISIPIGIIIGRNIVLFNLFMPLINFLRPIPSSAIIPLGIIILGIGFKMKLFVIIFGCSWPILINTIDGVRGIEPMFLKTSNVLGFTSSKILTRIVIPATLPSIFTGIKISLAISFILTITVEMIVGTQGIGYFIIDKERSFMFPEMYGGIICLGVIGLLFNNLFMICDRYINKWHYEIN